MHESSTELHQTADERLARDGQRYTSNRRALVDALRSAERPVTVFELLELIGGLAQSSAYRNLAVLEEAGVVHRLVTADDTARFELSEDLTGHHHHLMCSVCGEVVDIEVPPGLEEQITELADEAGRRHGFRVEHHRLDLLGVCTRCDGRDPDH